MSSITRSFQAAVRLQIREIFTERKGEEIDIGIKEAQNEGKSCFTLRSLHRIIVQFLFCLSSSIT